MQLSQNSCSQESIVISDDELNYSSFHSKHRKNKQFYDLEDSDTEMGNVCVDDNLDDIHLSTQFF